MKRRLIGVFPTGVGMAVMKARAFRSQKCSPRVWGWPETTGVVADWFQVFPTGVGMALSLIVPGPEVLSVPTGVGMARVTTAEAWIRLVFPTVWDGPAQKNDLRATGAVFPTGCGDGPVSCGRKGLEQRCSPRVWGWPVIGYDGTNSSLCSPRVWGWPVVILPKHTGLSVFPTGVGMARLTSVIAYGSNSVPHGCGTGPS